MNTAGQQCGSFHFTRKTDYGLLLLVSLAKNNTQAQVSLRKIAEDNNIPFAFLQKIAADLQKNGLIKSVRGKYGGQTLAKGPEEITIKQVVEALEGPVAVTQCTHPGRITQCQCAATCQIKHGMSRLNQELSTALTAKTLNHFLA